MNTYVRYGWSEEDLEKMLRERMAEKTKLEESLWHVKTDLRDIRAALTRIRAEEKRRKKLETHPRRTEIDAAKEAKKIAEKQRREEVLRMSRTGLKYADIAEVLGVSSTRARQLVARAERLERYKHYSESCDETGAD